MADPNYQRTTAASRRTLRISRTRFIHYSGTRHVNGSTYTVGATKRKALRWHDKQWAKRARRLAKVSA